MSKGSRLAPQGRPPKWKQSKNSIPNRKVRWPKWPHCLSENIQLNGRLETDHVLYFITIIIPFSQWWYLVFCSRSVFLCTY